MSRKISLLERYEIDIEKLDYGYIAQCENPSELEKIYKILLSNEEGFYPDLTEAAKRRLREVKPNSKCLRTEEKVVPLNWAEEELKEEVQGELNKFLQRVTKETAANETKEIEVPCVPIRSENLIENVPINQRKREENSMKIEEIRTESLSPAQLKELEGIHRNRGNNFYRAKEYQEALEEYRKCLEILPTGNGYNNRAATCK